jgi:lysozyme family protein
MKGNFDKAVAFVFVSEGGFAEKDTEPGGAVNMGVSMQTFVAFMAPTPVTIDDLRHMSVATATTIYQTRYAGRIGFDDMPAGLDYCMLDASVNEGVTASLVFLALAMNIKPYADAATPLDFAACMKEAARKINASALLMRLIPIAATTDVPAAINWICDNRLVEKRKRPIWPQDARGWTRRIDQYVRSNALAMVAQ